MICPWSGSSNSCILYLCHWQVLEHVLGLCDTDAELGSWVWLYVLRRCGNFSLSLHPRRTFSSALALRRENLLSSQTSLRRRRPSVRPSVRPSRASKQKAAAAAPCHNYGLRGLRSPKQAAQRARQKAETHCCTKQTKGHIHGNVTTSPWAGHD